MPQEQYSHLSKAGRRQLADPQVREASINIEGYPRLNLRFNQVLSKTPNHGEIHGLPVNGKDKVEKTKANGIAMRDSRIDLVKNTNDYCFSKTTEWK